jgi:O-antigen ligase/tetratricopeptide (TPR) repeat protein
LLAPLRGAQLDRVPVAAGNALIAAAVVLWAFLRRPAPRVSEPGPAGQPETSWRREPVTLCLWVFVAWNLLSLAVSIYAHATLTALLDLAALLCTYLLLAHGGGGRRAVHWVLGAVLAAGLVAAAQALSEYGIQAWQHTPLAPHGNPGWRAFGPFFNPNLLAAIAILLAPVALALMLRVERPGERFGAGAATLLYVAALLVSGSRGGALSLVAGGLAFIAVAAVRGLRLDRGRALAVAGLILALLPVLWILRVPMLGRLAHLPGMPALAAGSPAATASERSNAFRRLTWLATLRMVRARPLLGTGTGTFEFALPRYALAGYTQMAHESYLQTAAEAGVPALLAWLGALGFILARLLSRRHGTPDWLLPGIAGGLVAAMAHNLVDYSWSVMGTALPFWAYLGAAVALTPADSKYHGAGEPGCPPQGGRIGREADSGGGRAPGEARRGQDGATGRRGDEAKSDSDSRTPEHPNARTPERLNARRLALGVAAVLLLGLNAVWLRSAEHQARALNTIAPSQPAQERDPQAALDEYQAAAALTPLDAALQVELAGVEGALGETEAAAAAYRCAAALAPTWARPHYRLGRLWESAGQLPAAAEEFRQAAARDPRSTQPLSALAQVLEAQGQHAAALVIDHQMVATEATIGGLDEWTDPNPAAAHVALGQEAEAHGERAGAIREYRAAAERLRQWRLERPSRNSIQSARGESFAERDLDLLRLEARVWQWLADLYAKTGEPAAAAGAQREAASAQAAAASASAS